MRPPREPGRCDEGNRRLRAADPHRPSRPYGTIPAAVASVCTLTWFCAQGNIHATTKGYTLIGKLVVARFAVIRRR